MCLGCEGPSIAEPCSVRVVWRVIRNHPYLSNYQVEVVLVYGMASPSISFPQSTNIYQV
jgi:hypothetical protein